jgi:Domain of unknown function (DUF4386)
MSRRLQRLTGVTIVLMALAVGLGHVLGDPTIESHDDRGKFVAEVQNAADRIPVIYAFQAVEVASAFLAVAAGLGLYLFLRNRAGGSGLAGLLLFVLSGVFHAGTGIVGAGMIRAADDYVGGGVVAVSGSDNVLELIRVLAVLHFANFLAAFAALGIGVGAFAYQLAWPAGLAPRWLGWLGLIAGGLLVLTPLAVTADVLFLPFFFGAILTLVWLLVAGLMLALRPVRPGDAAGPHGSIGSALPLGGFGGAR